MVPIPVSDDIRRQIFWGSTLALIIANVLVFFFEISLGQNLDRLIYLFGIIPARYTTSRGFATSSGEGLFIPILVSMFLHSGWLHILSNMLFLFVFGRSVEDRYGHIKFLLLYFIAGFGAAVLHILLNAGSRLPTVGASGAIAGILGAYMISFPRARVRTLIWLFFFFWTVDLPALLLLGYWFLIQFFSGFEMLAIQSATRGGGVAWWAHVGGFIVGVLAAFVLRPRGRRPSAELVWP